MLALLLNTAVALDCQVDDDTCNTANAIRDGLNALSGHQVVTDDHRRGKRRTGFIQQKLLAIQTAADNGGCQVLGIDYFTIERGIITGAYDAYDGSSGTITGQLGSGSFDATCQAAAGEDDPCGPGMWGRWHFGSGTVGALHDVGFLMGGLARINGQRAIAWGVHGTCQQTISEVFAGYMPQMGDLEADDPRTEP